VNLERLGLSESFSGRTNCVFCEIVAGRSPARVLYLDEDIIVIFNKLTWVPVMLLVMPKQHLSQFEMWSSGLMTRLGSVAVDMGCVYAANGFRVLSNFGYDGMQSQSHGHLHVIGGAHLGPYA
jgi:histidine triad (HIT) family protein